MATNNLVNGGTITVSSGALLYLLGTTTAATINSITKSGGTVFIAGTVTGGTITAPSGGVSGWQGNYANVTSSPGGVLDDVAYQGTLDLTPSGSYLTVTDGTTFAGAGGSGAATINMNGSGPSTLNVEGTGTLDNATVNIGGSGNWDYITNDGTTGGGAVLTLGANLLIHQIGNNAELNSSNDAYDGIVNDGTINATYNGGAFDINANSFTNDGSIAVNTGDTLLDTGNRAIFENAGLAAILHPDFSTAARLQSWNEHACAPLAAAAAAVEPIRRRLAARAEAMGFAPPPPVETTTEPDLRLMVGGRVIRPLATTPGRCTFVLPPGATGAVLCSRAASPADIEPFHEDRRRLGVAVRRLRVHTADGLRDIAMDAPTLADGWWDAERSAGALWRWTNGAATVPLPGSATMLEVELHGTHRYPSAPATQRQAA